ncbi:MAG: hypothetical protein KA735_04955 [Burkholderiaceae bacterium]|nr:hypothetical protein [Burkholderiaceae bacterium]
MNVRHWPNQYPASQQGQALAEGLVVLLVLLSLWVGLAWLARLQDMALQATHGSRHAAFSATRYFDDDLTGQQVRSGYFSGPSHQWSLRSGLAVLGQDSSQVTVMSQSDKALDAKAQVGGHGLSVSRLRTELGTADRGILRAWVGVDLSSLGAHQTGSPSLLHLSDLDGAWPVLRRHTAILIDSGHAADDAAAQLRLELSPTAWAASSRRSYQLARQTDAVMGAVDGAWSRERPEFDWLQAWTGRVPDHHLQP